jgi:hypothetical protein
LAVAIAGAGCGGSIHVLPPDDAGQDTAVSQAQVIALGASLSESVVGQLGDEQVSVQVSIANLGGTPVTGVRARDARMAWDGVTIMVTLSPDATSPIAPDETRIVTFSGSVPPLGVCTQALEAQPNPHLGLATLGFTIASSAGGVALAGIDVAITCVGAPGDTVLTCDRSIADACADVDMQGNPVLHCTPDIEAFYSDTSYCGTDVVDFVTGCGRYLGRVLIVDSVLRTYLYDQRDPRHEDLSVVITSGPDGPVCVAGPTTGPFVLPACPNIAPPDGGYPAGDSPACQSLAYLDGGMMMVPPPDLDGGVSAPDAADDVSDQMPSGS